MDGHDVGVLQPGQHHGLAGEERLGVVAGVGRRGEHLDRHPALQRRVQGLVDLAHAAAADLAEQAVALVEQHARLHLARHQALDRQSALHQRLELLALAAGQALGVGVHVRRLTRLELLEVLGRHQLGAGLGRTLLG